MTASERLAALVPDNGDVTEEAIELLNALPEIVAVVRAAENWEEIALNHGAWGQALPEPRQLHAALAALDAKLGQ